VGRLQGLLYDPGQVISNRVQVQGFFQPGCEGRHCLFSVVPGPLEAAVYRALHSPPQWVEQGCRVLPAALFAHDLAAFGVDGPAGLGGDGCMLAFCGGKLASAG